MNYIKYNTDKVVECKWNKEDTSETMSDRGEKTSTVLVRFVERFLVFFSFSKNLNRIRANMEDISAHDILAGLRLLRIRRAVMAGAADQFRRTLRFADGCPDGRRRR